MIIGRVELVDPADRAELADEIDVTERGLSELTDHAISALLRTNDPPRIFLHASGLARLQTNEEGYRTLVHLEMHGLRNEMARAAIWRKRVRGQIVSTFPPREVVENVLATPQLPFPPIRRIVTVPFFDRSGELVVADGYHDPSKVYLAKEVVVPDFPLNPTSHETREAVGVIDDILSDFPFVAEPDRANAFALMLQPFCRDMINGPTPLFFFTAPSPGTGKSKLAEIMLLPACGTVSMGGLGKNEEETRKAITTFLLSGRPAQILDNVTRAVDSAALARLLTSTSWVDRILGSNTDAVLPNHAAWAMTSNNATLTTELARRAVGIRLDAGMERPQERTGFRHPNLDDYVRQHRPQIVAAVLTIIQRWIAVGQPAGDEVMGSYESWARVLGGILKASGITGFISNATRLLDAADEESESWRLFFAAWNDRHANADVLPKELLGVAVPIIGEPELGRERSAVTRLGQLLSAHRDRVHGDWRIERGASRREGKTWRLIATEPRRSSVDAVRLREPNETESSQNLLNPQNPSQCPRVMVARAGQSAARRSAGLAIDPDVRPSAATIGCKTGAAADEENGEVDIVEVEI